MTFKALVLIIAVLTTSFAASAQKPIQVNGEVVPIICYGNCPVIIKSGKATVQRRPNSRRYNVVAPAPYVAPRPAKRSSVPQVCTDPIEKRAQSETVGVPTFLKKQSLPGLDYGRHHTTLFNTAEPVEKGHKYYDFMMLGLYSGVQYGISENLEIGFKTVVPFLIATAIETDLFTDFLKYGVQLNAKYRFYKGENLHLAVRITAPLPSAELIATYNLGDLQMTGAVGVMLPLESEMAMTWWRASAKWKISRGLHLVGEYAQMLAAFENGTTAVNTLSTVAIRKINGRWSWDLGVGGIKTVESDEDYDDVMPILYVNFGYEI